MKMRKMKVYKEGDNVMVDMKLEIPFELMKEMVLGEDYIMSKNKKK